MLDFFKKLFGAKPVEVSPAPYKVETPAPTVKSTPVATPAVKKTVKKTAVKKATTRKPRAPKA